MRSFFLLLVAAALVALGAGLTTAHAGTKAPKTLVVVMHDPGCHWFDVDNTLRTKVRMSGPVRLVGYDEAPLVVKGPSGVRHLLVGASIVLGKGAYRITMVGQAPDDNHLRLVVT